MKAVIFGVVIVTSLIVASSALASQGTRPVRQDSKGMFGQWVTQDGCIQQLASFGASEYQIEDPAGSNQSDSVVFAGVTRFDECSNTYLIRASGYVQVADFFLSPGLLKGELRAQGFLTTFPDDTQIPFSADISFVPYGGRPGIMQTQHPGHFECPLPDGSTTTCNRILRDRGGYFEGSFVVGALEYVLPPTDTNNVEGGVNVSNTVCILPYQFQPTDCQLIEVP